MTILYTHKQTLLVLLLLLLSATSVLASPLAWQTDLPNGMRVIIIEDHSNPLATSIINIRAGSHTESIQNNGISHLLEHLLFDGTSRFSAAELKQEVESKGGYFNAFTRKDYVSFELVMPSETFARGLEIQADQLLNSVIPESELVRERRVVCEEIATDAESCSSMADALLWEQLFGASGYGLPVIGNYQTVLSVPRDTILSFYKSRYVPNRMTAVVIGDVQPQSVLETLKALYEDVSPGLENPGPGSHPVFPPDGLHKVFSRPVNGQALAVAYPGPDPSEPMYPAFEMAVSMWAESTLKPALKPFGTRVSAYVAPYRGFSIVHLNLTPENTDQPENYLNEVQSALQQSVTQFIDDPPMQKTLKAQIRSARVNHEFSREKFHHLARDIGHHSALGTLEHFWHFDQNQSLITIESIMGSFKQWLDEIQPVMVLILPDSDTQEAKTNPLEPQIRIMPDGLTVIAQFDPYADIAALHLLTPNMDTDVPGVPRIVAELLGSGTDTMTEPELKQALAEQGVRTKLADWTWLPFDDYYDSIEYNYLRMECLAMDLNYSMKLLKQMAFDSTLPDSAWQGVARRMSMMDKNNRGKSSTVSKRALLKILFSDPFHQQMRLPTADEIDKITPELLRDYYQQSYQSSACVLSVVGNVLPDDVFAMTEKLFKNKQAETSKILPAPEFGTPSRVFTSVDVEMGYIRGAIPLSMPDADLPAWSIAIEVLSEMLQDEIRAKRGKAYRLGAWLTQYKGGNVLEIGIGTRHENIEEIEAVTRDIVDRIKEYKVTPDIVENTKHSLMGHEQRYRQRRINRAYYLGWRHWLGQGIGFELEYLDHIKAVTVNDVQNAISSIPDAENWFWSIAGNGETDDE